MYKKQTLGINQKLTVIIACLFVWVSCTDDTNNTRQADEHMKVKLEVLVALAKMPESIEAGNKIFEVLTDSVNINGRWIREAAALAAAQHAGGFLNAAKEADRLINSDIPEDVDPAGTLASIVNLVLADNPDFDEASNIAIRDDELPSGVDAKIEIGVIPNVLKFDKEKLSAKAGQTIQLVFKNTGNMAQSLVLGTRFRPRSGELWQIK